MKLKNEIFCLALLINLSTQLTENEIQTGEKLFSLSCLSCHRNRNNVLIPEKNLKDQSLSFFGINDEKSLVYEIVNGKNSMPAFGGKLKQDEIEKIAAYILEKNYSSF